jgi:molecular chaperone GrpE
MAVNGGPDVEQLRTALAELEDAKQRVKRDGQRQIELMRSRVLEELLPAIDNLERVIQAAPAGPLGDGVRLVHQQLLDALAKFGLERRSAVGARFDPHLHDAVAVVPVDDAQKDGVVIDETEPAYMVGDRVVRPAKVQVGRAAVRTAS